MSISILLKIPDALPKIRVKGIRNKDIPSRKIRITLQFATYTHIAVQNKLQSTCMDYAGIILSIKLIGTFFWEHNHYLSCLLTSEIKEIAVPRIIIMAHCTVVMQFCIWHTES